MKRCPILLCWLLLVVLSTGPLPRGNSGVARAQQVSVQTPTFGISIDADGVLSTRTFADPTGKLRAQRLAEARRGQPAEVGRWSELRKISLVQLERALARELSSGRQPDDVMMHLAGLQRAKYVFLYPEEQDIVIAGPAEGWVDDLSGRSLGLTTGRPVLLLADLAVALRAFPPEQRGPVYLGCSIDPRPEGLKRLAQFQKTIPREIADDQRGAVALQIAEGMRESLGLSQVRVFGVSDKTHLAQVLIEADYRMKLIGIGVEAPPVKMVTFIAALDSPRAATLQRWWFTPHYDCVKVTSDRLAMELLGEGVQLLDEDMLLGPDGRLTASGKTLNKASQKFTTSFTREYAGIAARVPVFAQLRNMIDLVVIAAFLREQNAYDQAGWRPGVFADEKRWPVETLPTPKYVPCAVTAFWKDNRLLVPAGGVGIRPSLALEASRRQTDRDGKLGGRREQNVRRADPTSWWWD
ncbi:MAG: DUF1598 domain-containing protein [Planctomycetes bacterium]|nr:DUF1598 domain-containing protein [Planctomycetota bacterium]